MTLPVTEGIYSKDNYEPNLCLLPNNTVWTAWAAYARHGSRTFVRRFTDKTAEPIRPISDSNTMQTRPICIPLENAEVEFVWLEKTGQTYSIWTRRHTGEIFTECKCLHTLPASAKPWELQALRSEDGALWICWAQSVKSKSTIECLCIESDLISFSLTAGSPYNYRPRMVEYTDHVYLAWDAYLNKTYDIYGCEISPNGPSAISKISASTEWGNRSALGLDSEGILHAVWVHCADVIYNNSTIQQKYEIRGARHTAKGWQPLTGPDGELCIAPLHYGLLTDFPKSPNLGHMGRRLFPMLKTAQTGGIWLFYEAKADEGQGTLASKGRLFGHHHLNNTWSGPLNIAEGNVFYELPHNSTVGDNLYLLSQDTITDEQHLSNVRLSTDLPPVPAENRTINIAQWKEVHLPFPDAANGDHPCNELPGKHTGRYRLFWADLHCHSAASIEVEGEPDELGHYARDKARIDAFTISDNDNFWNRFTRQNVRHLKDYEWDYVKGNALVLNRPGEFAMFPGYEMTITDRVDSGRDHRSVMSDDDEMEMDLLHFKYEDAYWRDEIDYHKDTRECINWFKKKGYLPLPHPHHGKWNVYDTDVEWGIDVCAAWMINIDLFDIYFKHLNEGHRFAFTASGDSHHRNPGLSGALTGIWAERLDRATLLDAIKNRRCFATAGHKILLEFTVNDLIMGSTLAVDKDPVLKWRVIGDPDQDYILRIHRDGRLMYDDRFTGHTLGEKEDTHFCRYRPGKHYYHIEVLSPDPIPQYPANVAHARGAKAWSTPIWVENESQWSQPKDPTSIR